MLLRGYVTDKRNNESKKKKEIFKPKGSNNLFTYNTSYEPIRGSDIFCELPPKNEKYKPYYQNQRNYEIYYNKKLQEERYTPNNEKKLNNKSNSVSGKIYNIMNLRYSFNPYNTTYNEAYIPREIDPNTLVGNDKNLGTGVAYNSKKKRIEFLKSNIFCERDKYNQNNNLRDNFDPKNITHNNWFTKLDWRNNKSELIFYKDNQKEFYDQNSKENQTYFRQNNYK